MPAPGPPRRSPLPAGLGPDPPGVRRRVPTAPGPHRACRRWSRRAATARARPGRGHRGAHAAAPLPNAGKRLRGLVRAGGKNSWPRASPATGLPPLPPRCCPSGPPARRRRTVRALPCPGVSSTEAAGRGSGSAFCTCGSRWGGRCRAAVGNQAPAGGTSACCCCGGHRGPCSPSKAAGE